jgi:hypothetical protein
MKMKIMRSYLLTTKKKDWIKLLALNLLEETQTKTHHWQEHSQWRKMTLSEVNSRSMVLMNQETQKIILWESNIKQKMMMLNRFLKTSRVKFLKLYSKSQQGLRRLRPIKLSVAQNQIEKVLENFKGPTMK